MRSVDCETVGERLFGAAISDRPGQAVYYPGHGVIPALREGADKGLLMHNAKFDLQVLEEAGFDWHEFGVDDTELLAYCMNYNDLHLKVLETQELSLMHPTYDEIVGGKGRTLADVPVEKTGRYCGQDADVTGRLWPYLWEQADERERNLYLTIERPLLPVLTDMETKGIQVDQEYAQQWAGELLAEAEVVLGQLKKDYGLEPKLVNSPKQLGDWLVGQGVKLPKTEASGQVATGKELLASRLSDHASIPIILKYRQLMKLKSTYADACLEMADAGGRIHTKFNQTRVVTGRLSSSEPNLQNLPYTFAARRPYTAKAGHKLASLDYSQVDMRCLAVITEDKGLLDAFARGEDIHNWMSDRAFGDHEPMHRHIIKAANYLTIYGGGAKTLHLYLNAPMGQFDISQMGQTLSLEDCQGIIDGYYIAFPRVAEWQEETKRFARQNGYVDDYYGRRRYFPELESPNRRVRMTAEREVINMPIAGTAAELFKLSIIAVYGLAVPVLNVHDELVFELPEASLDDLVPKLGAAMQGVVFPVPLVVGSKVGNNLGELI